MRPERLSLLHLLFLLLVSPLIFSAHLTWSQGVSPARKTLTQVPVLAPQSGVVQEAGVRLDPANGKLALSFAPEQRPARLRFRTFDLGYLFALSKNGPLNRAWQLTTIDKPQARANRSEGNAPTEWLTSPIPQETVRYRMLDRDAALRYYVHSMPWVGRIMLGVGRQAAFHPRALRVFEIINPALSFEKTNYPRWLHR